MNVVWPDDNRRSAILLPPYLHIRVGAPSVYRHTIYAYPMYADIHRCVDTSKKGVAILTYRKPTKPIEGIYLST
jgi:hypothetical protein